MTDANEETLDIPLQVIAPIVSAQPILMDANDELALNDDDDDDDAEFEGDPLPFRNALTELTKRCTAAKIDCEDILFLEEQRLLIKFPAGRQKRNLIVTSLEQAEALLGIEFELYSFVSDYEAICCPKDGYIEASLGGLGAGIAMYRLNRSLFGSDFRGQDPNQLTLEIPIVNADSQVKLKFHLATKRLRAFPSRFFSNSRSCITLEGLEFRTNEKAAKFLETIADSFLFELDARFNIPLGLQKARRMTAVDGRGIRRDDRIERKPLEFPDCQYDRQAISLYWYGRSATGMPLLRFLAFYQSVEFYFPVFSQNEAIKNARTLLKDPRFSVHDDKDMSKLLSSIQGNRSGGFGDERTQFKATLNACLHPVSLREFLLASDTRRNFYTDPNHLWKTISTVKLAINEVDGDLRTHVADRLYDIRCRIVHTKVDGGQSRTEVLLPFSKESEDLFVDIELVQYVARQVLIATSSKLNL